MRILFGVGHPKHVHFSKNIINNLLKKGHEIKIAAIGKDITLQLLDTYGFDFEVVGKNYRTLTKKAYGLIESDLTALKVAKKFKPDILVGGSPYLAHISKLIGKPHIGFTDTEHATLTNWISFAFSDVICTPTCYKGRIDPRKHVTYNGYEELAYLHPSYFKPDPRVLEELGLAKDDRYIIMRLNSWNASHDTNSRGFSKDFLEKSVNSLEKYVHVFITSEKKLSISLEKYKLNISPENVHSILSYSQMYIGEGETMAAESAILGTPSIDVEAVKLKQGIVDISAIHGNADELINKYELMFAFSNQNLAIKKAIELLEDNQLKNKWSEKREKLLKEKINVTPFMTELIDKYPEKS